MENLKIGLERDNGKILGYNVDVEVINGLYLTYDNQKIHENISNFNIDIEVVPNQTATKISKRDRVSIVSMFFDEERKFQYLVGADLNLNEFENLDRKLMPEEVRELIREAYRLTQSNSLSGLL